MRSLSSIRGAKEYLAGRIVAEAEREGTLLSEAERKMLYFSETDWTLPNILEINAEFERDYDVDAYEQKIGRLVSEIQAHDAAEDPEQQDAWDQAVVTLSEGDHYLLVLIDGARSIGGGVTPARGGFVPTLNEPAIRPPHDRLKLWFTAFVVVFGTFGLAALLNWLFGPKFWAVVDWVFDRDRGKPLVVIVTLTCVFGWVLRSELRGFLRAFFSRE